MTNLSSFELFWPIKKSDIEKKYAERSEQSASRLRERIVSKDCYHTDLAEERKRASKERVGHFQPETPSSGENNADQC
jgi:hypothetical protein